MRIKHNILVTCPPMLAVMENYRALFAENNATVSTPEVIQTLDENTLLNMVSEYDGWIVGDDPVSENVLKAGSDGKLKVIIKWGVGVDNINFNAAKKFNINIENTPAMFGNEVADIAVNYIIGLARHTYKIDREIRKGKWPKYQGISLENKVVGLVGYGDIGKQTAKRLLAAEVKLHIYDPLYIENEKQKNVTFCTWPEKINNCDFIVFTCALNSDNKYMLDAEILELCKDNVRVINVSRGGLINENALVNGLVSGKVASAALDVMEAEPLPTESRLRDFDNCIFGSHNSSNTVEAVNRVSYLAIKKVFKYLENNG
jgi:D-3-phosphoglycerate dehydrogenase